MIPPGCSGDSICQDTQAEWHVANKPVQAYNAKLTDFRVLCAYFNEAAKQSPSGPDRSFAEHLSSSFLELWSQTFSHTKSALVPTHSSLVTSKVRIDLHRIPQALEVTTGRAIRGADATTRHLPIQRQSEWAKDLDARLRWTCSREAMGEVSSSS